MVRDSLRTDERVYPTPRTCEEYRGAGHVEKPVDPLIGREPQPFGDPLGELFDEAVVERYCSHSPHYARRVPAVIPDPVTT